MTRILLVDDDRQLRRAMHINLRAAGYQVVAAATGIEALTQAASMPPDIVILDLGLPDLDGVAVLEALRGWCAAPVVVLSARHEEQAKVRALDAGADDYVTKPFGMGELLARLRAASRRSTPHVADAVVTTSAFKIDLAARRVTVRDTDIRLTPTEWRLLEVLIRDPGRLITQRQALQQVWGPTYETETNYLRVHIANLRHKLEPDPAHPRYLITEPGIGYRFEPDDTDASQSSL